MAFPGQRLSVAMAGIIFATSVTACGYGPLGLKSCRQEAKEQIIELKQVMHGVLPAAIASTQEEGDDCDSAEGGSLLYVAEATVGQKRILEEFIAKGWHPIDRRDKNACPPVDCIDGVTTQWKDKIVDVTLEKSQDQQRFYINVVFRPD